MAVTVTIAGATKSIMARSLNITEGINGRATAEFQVFSADGSYAPALDDEVFIAINGTTVFGGLVVAVTRTFPTFGAGVICQCEVADFSHYAERRLVSASTSGGFPARDAVDAIVQYFLAVYGVTRDPAMGPGATLGALDYKFAKISEVLDDLVRLAAPAGWVWKITDAKVLTGYLPGTVACPFTLDDAHPNIVGDVTIRAVRESYANRLYYAYTSGGTTAFVTAENAAEIAAHGIYEAAINTPAEMTTATAQSLADARLAQLIATPIELKFRTDAHGARAGQTLSVGLTYRGLFADYLITSVRTWDADGVNVFYDITAVQGNAYRRTWQDTYAMWAGSSVTSSVPLAVPSPPSLDAVIYSQDFESGNAVSTLAINYTGGAPYGVTNATGEGLGGTTWGALSSVANPVMGFQLGAPGFGAARTGWIEFRTDFSDLEEYGWTLAAATVGNYFSGREVFDLYVGTESGARKFWLSSGAGGFGFATTTNVFSANTDQLVRLEFVQSTYTAGTVNSDGIFRVFINNSLVWNVTGVEIAEAFEANSVEIQRVYLNPCGRLDEIRIGAGAYIAVATTGWQPLADALALTGLAPSVRTTTNIGAGSLTVSGQAPTL